MKNKNFGILASFLVGMLLLVGASLANSGFSFQGTFHELMEEIMEKGSFEDLQMLREKNGFNMMPFVNDEESFQKMKEHHEEMEGFHEQGNSCPMIADVGGCTMMAKGQNIHISDHHEGCPMMNN
ncbi:hypothetical protein CMO90_02205 [Candidatus Woesearchaeota archaeon]|nr:hypothetical protein [Candidatus Woesearchaeota archaeon]|tara:strand:+ start:978 stop:1352 length:375 start_codon:yes stop_codon:yes gene_type:complete